MAMVDMVYKSILVSVVHITVLHTANSGFTSYKNNAAKKPTYIEIP